VETPVQVASYHGTDPAARRSLEST
jgi:hypothetical protein